MEWQCSPAFWYQMGSYRNPDSHEANIGPIWGQQVPDGPHVGPMNFAIWLWSDGPMTTLFDIWPWRFHRTWEGRNRSTRIWVPDENALPEPSERADDPAIAHLRAKTIPYDLRWNESVQRLWSCSVYKVQTDGRTEIQTEEGINGDYFIVPTNFLC